MQCWGDNNVGQLGNGTTVNSTTPAGIVLSNAMLVVAGTYHSCAVLLGGTVQCWGDNSSGELGDGTTTNALTPTTVAW